jgi:hypothetical protein
MLHRSIPKRYLDEASGRTRMNRGGQCARISHFSVERTFFVTARSNDHVFGWGQCTVENNSTKKDRR